MRRLRMRAGRAGGSSVRRDSGILCISRGESHLDFGEETRTGRLLYQTCTKLIFRHIFAIKALRVALSVLFI
jgi:hypothetical protein